MDPKVFLELTEAELLKDIGNRLKTFFTDELVDYEEVATGCQECGFGKHYDKKSTPNPRATIYPLAQINMVANVTFHLMAQQIAILFEKREGINREQVYATAFDNIRKLVVQYSKQIREAKESGEAAPRAALHAVPRPSDSDGQLPPVA